MDLLCLTLLLCAVVLASGHYAGYPFVHQNEGKYGAAYKVANYGASKVDNYGANKVAPRAYSPYGSAIGYGFNHEHNYRGLGAFPVHVGNGQFYYLGQFSGDCKHGYNYGFYFTENANSFVVCDHGRAHTFQCPKGTKNRDAGQFTVNHRYDMNELCGVNTNH